jgi:cyclin T
MAHRPAAVVSQLSPSLRKDNNMMSIKEEIDMRRRTCRYIDESCRLLKLPKIAAATAMVFVHRFYYYASNKLNNAFCRDQQHDRFEVATAAVLLASKIEECPKKVDHVIAVCHDLLQNNRGVQAGNNKLTARSSSRTTRVEKEADDDDEAYIKTTLKERVLLLERVLLHTIGFELSIDHPYQFIAEQIRRIEFTPGNEALSDQMKKWYGKGGGMHL